MAEQFLLEWGTPVDKVSFTQAGAAKEKPWYLKDVKEVFGKKDGGDIPWYKKDVKDVFGKKEVKQPDVANGYIREAWFFNDFLVIFNEYSNTTTTKTRRYVKVNYNSILGVLLFKDLDRINIIGETGEEYVYESFEGGEFTAVTEETKEIIETLSSGTAGDLFRQTLSFYCAGVHFYSNKAEAVAGGLSEDRYFMVSVV